MARRCLLALAFASILLAGCAAPPKETVSPWSNVPDPDAQKTASSSPSLGSGWIAGAGKALASALNGLKGK